MENKFRYECNDHGNTIAALGDLEWDKEKKQYRATLIVQKNPEIRYDAWHDDGAVAGLMCIAKWMGRDLCPI